MSHRRLLSRARRGEDHNRAVGNERWLISYSDFITLLFAFFVVMYSVSHVNEAKYRTLSDTLNQAFKSNSSSFSNSSQQQQKQKLADLNVLAKELEQSLAGFPVSGEVSMGANENWIELSLESELLFTSGSAETSLDAQRIFSELASTLAQYDNDIQISGHTDSLPISNPSFSNNWELSSARALAVVNEFSRAGVDAKRLAAVAFGEYRPVASNDTIEGRAKNRRVVLRVASSVAAESVNVVQGSEVDTSEVVENANADAEIDTVQLPQEISSNNAQTTSNSDEGIQGSVKPVRLKGGDLLFSSDPDLPRLRPRERDQ